MNSILTAPKSICKTSGLLYRFLNISSVRLSHTKTPVQEFGWEYIKRQRSLNRPLSPHLSIYKPQLTWMLSGLHRITGTILGGTLFVGGIGFALLPLDFTTFVEFIRSLNLPTVITDAFKFIIAFPIVFYSINEVRMLGFEIAKGIDLPTIYRTGWLVLGLSLTISLLIVLNAKRQKRVKQQ